MNNQLDIRAFSYALEPVLLQQKWKLERLQAEIGRCQRLIHESKLAIETLRSLRDEHAETVRRSMSEKLNLTSYRHALAYITKISTQVAQKELELAELCIRREELRTACTAQQKQMEMIEHHRDECLAEYRIEQQNRMSNEADSDWIARLQWHNRQNAEIYPALQNLPEEAA